MTRPLPGRLLRDLDVLVDPFDLAQDGVERVLQRPVDRDSAASSAARRGSRGCARAPRCSVCPCPPRRYRATSSRASTAWVMSSSSTVGIYHGIGHRGPRLETAGASACVQTFWDSCPGSAAPARFAIRRSPARVRAARQIASVNSVVEALPPRSRVRTAPLGSVSTRPAPRGCARPHRALAEVVEHHQRRQQQRGRVRQVLVGDVRRAAVHRLEHRASRSPGSRPAPRPRPPTSPAHRSDTMSP